MENISSKPGIYIHIPFCDTKCGYCDFYSITNHSNREKFVELLLSEMALYAKAPFITQPFDTIYFGGGTPSLLTPSELELIFNTLHTLFPIDPNCEITLEANPGTLDNEKLNFYSHAGINRLSMGVQSFDDDELKMLNRLHNSNEAIASVEKARKAGITNISIDLIFALPKQGMERWRKNLDQAFALQTEHISAYNLIFEEGTPFYKALLNGSIKKKSDEEELRFFSETMEQFTRQGYIQYEVSNYARSVEYFSRHNYKYWNHTPYLSFGPSAHSFWNNKRWSNVRALSKYLKMLEKGAIPSDFSEELKDETLIFETIMLGLRTEKGIALSAFKKRFNIDFMTRFSTLNKNLSAVGYAKKKGDYFKLTTKGLTICDEIIPQYAAVD